MLRRLAPLAVTLLATGCTCLMPALLDDADRPPPRPAQRVVTGVAYHGHHPIPDELGGGWCSVRGGHVHDYEPLWTDQYTWRDERWEWGTSVDWYYDPGHPLPARDGGWCDRPGRHRHDWRPDPAYRYEPRRRVFVYNPTPSGRRPEPTRPEPTRPEPTRPRPEARPRPSYPVERPTEYAPDAQRPRPSEPEPRRPQPIPYGDDVRARPVEPPPARPEPTRVLPRPTYPDQPTRPFPTRDDDARVGQPVPRRTESPVAPANPTPMRPPPTRDDPPRPGTPLPDRTRPVAPANPTQPRPMPTRDDSPRPGSPVPSRTGGGVLAPGRPTPAPARPGSPVPARSVGGATVQQPRKGGTVRLKDPVDTDLRRPLGSDRARGRNTEEAEDRKP